MTIRNENATSTNERILIFPLFLHARSVLRVSLPNPDNGSKQCRALEITQQN